MSDAMNSLSFDGRVELYDQTPVVDPGCFRATLVCSRLLAAFAAAEVSSMQVMDRFQSRRYVLPGGWVLADPFLDAAFPCRFASEALY
jgi:hypothetical protein